MVESPLSLLPFRAGTPRQCKQTRQAESPKKGPGRLTIYASTRQNPKSTRGIQKRTWQL